MNREIKFRAFGKHGSEESKYMVDDWQNTTHPEYFGFNGGNAFHIMQFTGLKDKNGVDIYEGDIVSHPNPLCKGVIKFGNYEYNGTDYCEWGHGFYIDRIDQYLIESICERDIKRIEVIGNIHENPELL